MRKASDIMTKKVVSILPDTSIVEAVNKLFKYNFSGLPVIDKDNKLLGILTEYDLVIKGSSVYLPTFIKFFDEIDLYKKDKGLLKDDFRKVLNTKVGDVMNIEPLTLDANSSLEEVFRAFEEHHRVNPIPIIDSQRRVTGIISRSDLLKFIQSPNIKSLNLTDVSQREIDKNLEAFLKDVGNRFVLVSKFRTHSWLITSILFAIVGYFVAWFWILRFI